ncbi:MAG: tRNA 5-hydroxyuridine modification protein YegQ [Gammaproteobacteria bacterium]|nr:tRNA 5-hydroxyuridine modification protein YegQ [Gammaproteobacteria bacterium]
MKIPELLSPAGTFKNMQYAFAYGADAVYAGQPRYSLRVRNNDFTLENLKKGIVEAHSLGKKFFVASNLMPHNVKLKTYIADMEPVVEMKPDALIMADPGLIMMVRERWPEQTIHLSVQANTVNYAAVKFWQSVGVERVILSRELSLDEIEEIKQRCPDMELEVFVHGALCIAYSGRCLLSGYMNHRDPNQGTCTNSCRWEYGVHKGEENDAGEIVKATNKIDKPVMFDPAIDKTSDEIVLIEEANRPGELMPMFEDEHGTYIMNSKDLRAIQHVQRLAEIGVDSLKIEGRTKSHYYTARTAQIYRQAIDDAVQGKEFNMDLMGTLDGLANRGYTEGFYRRHVPEEYQNYTQGSSISTKQKFVGEVMADESKDGVLAIDVKNKFAVGDSVELMYPGGSIHFVIDEMHDFQGNVMDVAKGSGHKVKIKSPVEGESPLGLLMINMN